MHALCCAQPLQSCRLFVTLWTAATWEAPINAYLSGKGIFKKKELVSLIIAS